VQPGTSPRQLSRCVNGHGALAIPAVRSHYTKQFDGQLSLPAADARTDRSFVDVCRVSHLSSRSLALDHGSV